MLLCEMAGLDAQVKALEAEAERTRRTLSAVSKALTKLHKALRFT